MLKYGAAELSDAELLALLIRTGKKGENAIELARSVIKTHELDKLAEKPAPELKKIRGIKIAKAAVIAAAFELGRRAARPKKEISYIRTLDDVAAALRELETCQTEKFISLCVSSSGRLLRRADVGVGGLAALALETRDVFRPALEKNAVGLIVAHNHPAGDIAPSPEDVYTTKKLARAGKLLGIKLLDHVIIAGRAHLSLAEAAPHLFR